MKINKENAIKLWEERYEHDVEDARDFTGRCIHKYHYNDFKATKEFEFTDGTSKRHKSGWNLHHILPISKGGTNDEENLEIVNILTNDEAEDKTSFIANGRQYQVKRIKGSGFHGIYEYNYDEDSYDECVVDNT